MQNKDSKNIDVARDARKGFVPLLKKSAPFLGLFFMIGGLVWLIDFLLSYVGAGTVLLTLLILGAVVVPFFFSAVVCSFLEKGGRTIGAKDYFRTAGLYYTPSFFGSFRILRSILFSFLVSIIVYFVFSVFYVSLSRYFDPNLMSDVDQLYAYLGVGDAEAASKFLTDSLSIRSFSRISSFAMDAGFTLSFMFFLGRYTIMVFIRDAMVTPDSRIVNAAYKEALRSKARGYNSDFLKATWWVYLILLLFYAGGAITGYLLLQENAYVGILMNLVGVGFMLIPLTILIPYYVLAMDNLFLKHKEAFVKATIDLARRAFEELKYMNQIGEEDAKKYEEALKEAEDNLMKGDQNPDVYDAEASEKDPGEENKEE